MAARNQASKNLSLSMILAVLRHTDRHGYDIAREIERRSDGIINFNDGTLYPGLHALEREGFITSTWHTVIGDRSRRVYALTEDGRVEADRQAVVWRAYANALNKVLQTDN